ncbi:MAG: hypothetical protein RLZZ299_1572 [Pseudomonadota bacterium]
MLFPLLTSLVAPVLAASPAARADAKPIAPVDARFALALWCDPTCPDTVFDTLDAALANVAAVDGLPERVARPSRVMGLAGPEFGVHDAAFLAAHGVGVDRPEALGAARQVVLAWFAAPAGQARTTLAAAHAAFARAADTAHGWVEDLDTQRVYGSAAWRALEPEGPREPWFVVDDGPGEGDARRLVTRGLRRFGEVELVVDAVAPDATADTAAMLVALAETGASRPAGTYRLDGPVVRGVATLTRAEAREGDPEDPLAAVAFQGTVSLPAEPSAPPDPAGEALRRGDPPPPQDPAPKDLAEARAQARAALAGPVREAFARGLSPGGRLLVKAPFPTRRNGREYMWVAVARWDGDTLEGTLVNTPWDVPGLARGDTVRVALGDTFDYLLENPDGSRSGNGTAAFLR